jgi:hypothetical protein
VDDAPITPSAAPAGRKHFYEACVDDPDKLVEAMELEGVDAEIAFLRTRLEQYARDHPGDLSTLARSNDLIVRAVAARYRMSPKKTEDLAAAMEQALRAVGDAILSRDDTDV